MLDSPVIIIDGFDSAIINAISRGKAELAEAMRDAFNSFYKVIKSNTGKIRFLFITGCTKLSGLSIFSAMNNLNDISADYMYAGMLDAMLLTKRHDWIIEFKADGETSDNAMSQIADRHYSWILEREDKPLHLIGIDFCTDKQQIASYTHQIYGSDVIEHKVLG